MTTRPKEKKVCDCGTPFDPITGYCPNPAGHRYTGSMAPQGPTGSMLNTLPVEHTPRGGYDKECECTDNGNDGRTRGKNCDILHIPNPQHVPSSKCEHWYGAMGRKYIYFCPLCETQLAPFPDQPKEALPAIEWEGGGQMSTYTDRNIIRIGKLLERLVALTHGTGEKQE